MDEEHERRALNIADPMAEADKRRRIWAAYLHRGHTRSTFAHALGSTWSVVQAWDTGRAVVSLKMLERVREVLGFSLEELCFGKHALVSSALGEPVLDQVGLINALRETNAAHDARAAFARHLDSPEGRLQDVTRTYVHAWVAGWSARSGAERGEREQGALQNAVNARAVTRATSTRGPLDLSREDVSPHEHERIGRSVSAAAAQPIVKTGARRARPRGRT